jgi:hypothetical protein
MINTDNSYLLKTLKGRQVYVEGFGKFKLTRKGPGGFSRIPLRFRASANTPENFDRVKAKAEEQLGQPLQWVEGPVVEFINI